MYTTHHSCWDAKNRYNLPDEVPFTYESIRQILEPGTAPAEEKQEVKQPDPVQETPPAPSARLAETVKQPETVSSNKGNEKPAEEKKGAVLVEGGKGDIKPDERSALDPRIPKKLRDLMIANDVCEWDIQNVCEAKGYVPVDTPLYMYEEVNPGFVDGVLVGAWDQVYAAIREMKEKDSLVFN